MTIAEYIALQLHKHGVRYVFGIPGGPSIPYMEAFRNAGIEFILTTNEASAGIMADVTARISGIPGVCHATFGPGATNISTGIGGALLDRSPVIVFTSEIDDLMIGRTTQMNINHQQLFEPLTKVSYRLSVGNAEEVVASALRICNEEYPGPVHIGLPSDIALKMIEIREDFNPPEPENTHFENEIHKIISLLDNSRHPLLAVGLTASRLGIESEILSFLETYRMPVILTPMAKGIIPEDHPCYAGVLFHSLSDYLEDLYEHTDLVIGLGYDPVEYNYESWMPDVPLIHFDTIRSEVPLTGNCINYAGPPEEWFRILDNFNRSSLVFEGGIIKGVRDEMISVFGGFTNHFGPAAVLKILQDELPDNTVITSDVGSHLHIAGQFWRCNGNKNLIMTNGWSSMGFGIPAAMAVQLNKREHTVVCITGDGGFLMMAGEIVTALRYNLPIIIVVFSDGELNLIKVKQSWKNISPYATTLYQGDLFGSDIFLGVNVLTANSHESMNNAVIEALSLNEPVIINAIIDPEDYNWLIVKR